MPGAVSGRLLAAVANLTVPQLIVIGGEGSRLATVAATAVQDGLRADRDPRARAVQLAMMSGRRSGLVPGCRRPRDSDLRARRLSGLPPVRHRTDAG